jgi:hypothetical protein
LEIEDFKIDKLTLLTLLETTILTMNRDEKAGDALQNTKNDSILKETPLIPRCTTYCEHSSPKEWIL